MYNSRPLDRIRLILCLFTATIAALFVSCSSGTSHNDVRALFAKAYNGDMKASAELEQMGAQAGPALDAEMRSGDELYRMAVARFLARHQYEPALKELRSWLGGENPTLSFWAVRRLGEVRDFKSTAMIEMLARNASDEAMAAVYFESLEHMLDPKSQETILWGISKGKGNIAKAHAIRAAGKLGIESATPGIWAAASSEDATVNLACLDALSVLEKDKQKVRPLLLRTLLRTKQARTIEVRQKGQKLRSYVYSPEFLPALGALRDDSALQTLEEIVRTGESGEQAFAVEAIGKIGSKRAVAFLKAQLAHSPTKDMRGQLEEAIRTSVDRG